MLSLYDEECNWAVQELSQHVNNKDSFSLQMPNVGVGVAVTGDLSKKIYRQSYYKDCTFDSTKCISTGFSGSKFIDTIFQNANLEKANCHSCDFNGVTFTSNNKNKFKMIGAGFHKSTFTNCIFKNMYIYSCGFTDVVFHNTIFKNCTIRLCSLENAQFYDCHFIDTNMSTLNLEYTEFNNIFATNTIFPFITIPSAYGLLQQLPSLENDNVVYSASNENHEISIHKYLGLLNYFECFYAKKENYYALANIYISQEKFLESYKAIETGILNAIAIKDFRVLRHFCKLVYLCNIFTIKQRRNLYENIMTWVSNESLSLAEYHNYQLFAAPIREMLLNNDYQKPTIFFYIKTNIDSVEVQKNAILLATIDQILSYCQISSNSIELRHNSSYVDFLTVVCDSLAQFSQVLIMIYGALGGVRLFASAIRKIVDTSQVVISGYDQHKISKLEQKKLEAEIENMEYEKEYKKKMDEIEYQKSIAELKKLDLEIEDMEKKADKYNKILLENGIEISVRHTSKNLRSAPVPEMIQYNQ